MSLRLVRCAVVLFVVVFIALPARAEGKHNKGQKFVEQGKRAYNLGHWADALTDFEKAYELSGDATLLFNLAETHRQLGQNADALRLYNAYLRELPSGPDHETAEMQVKNLSEATAPKAPAPAVTPPPRPTTPPPAPPTTAARPAPVWSPPPPASARAPVAATPAPAKSPTWPPPATTPPPASSAWPPPARTSPPASSAWPAPKPVAATTPPPASPNPPPPAPGPVVTPIAPAAAGGTFPPSAVPPTASPPTLVAQPAPPARHRSKWPVIAGAAATGAFAAGAIAFQLSGDSLYNDLKSSCGNTTTGCASSQIDSVKTRDHAATAFWILAGAAAVATSVVWVLRF